MNSGLKGVERVNIVRANQGGNALVERYSGFNRSELPGISRRNAITGLGAFGGLALVTSVAKAQDVTGKFDGTFTAHVGSANGASFDEAIAGLRAQEARNNKAIKAVGKQVAGVQTTVDGIKTDMGTLQANMNTLTTATNTLATATIEIRKEVTGVKNQVDGLVVGLIIGGAVVLAALGTLIYKAFGGKKSKAKPATPAVAPAAEVDTATNALGAAAAPGAGHVARPN
jgi:hypothetical protein